MLEFYAEAVRAAGRQIRANWWQHVVFVALVLGLEAVLALVGEEDLTLLWPPVGALVLFFLWYLGREPAHVWQQARNSAAELRHSLEAMGQANADLQAQLAAFRTEAEQKERFRLTLRAAIDPQAFEDVPRLRGEPGTPEQQRLAGANMARARSRQISDLMRESGFPSQADRLDEIALNLETTQTLDEVMDVVKEWQAQLTQQFLNDGELEVPEAELRARSR